MSIKDMESNFDSRLSHVETGLAGLKGIVETNQIATIDRIDRLTTAVENQQQQSSVKEWTTKDVMGVATKTILGVITLLLSMMFGMAQYTNGEISELSAPIKDLQESRADAEEFTKKAYYEFGKAEQQILKLEEYNTYNAERQKQDSIRLRELEKEVSSLQSST
jgi:triphosphoribosyl-dephospho-CoA synthetase